MGIRQNILYLSGLREQILNEESSEEREVHAQAKLLKAYEEFIRNIRSLKYDLDGGGYYGNGPDGPEKRLKELIKAKEGSKDMREKLYKIAMDKMEVAHKVIKDVFGKSNEEDEDEDDEY